jgi:hypothetical protein
MYISNISGIPTKEINNAHNRHIHNKQGLVKINKQICVQKKQHYNFTDRVTEKRGGNTLPAKA